MPYIETETRYENTTMREIRNNDNVLMGYDIAPIEGYVLHNSAFDHYEETVLISRGYSPSSSSVESDYDFEANPYEIYAIEKDSIGENDVIH